MQYLKVMCFGVVITGVAACSLGQNQSGNVWERTYGEAIPGSVSAAVLTQDGNIFAAGRIKRDGGNNLDLLLLKIDAKGDVLWKQSYGHDGLEQAEDIIGTKDGGTYLCGYTVTATATGVDMYVVRVDAKGELLWEKNYGEAEADYCKAIALTEDGGLVILGSTLMADYKTFEINLLRIDAEGEPVWQKIIKGDGAKSTHANAIATAKNGNVYIGGSVDVQGQGKTDMYLARMDLNGKILWENTYSSEAVDSLETILVDPNGELFLAGRVSAEDGGENMVLMKVNANGKLLWSQNYPDKDEVYEGAFALVQAAGGGVYMGGYSSVNDRGEMGDIILKRLDSSGKLLWNKAYGGKESEYASALIRAQDGGLFLGGVSYSNCIEEEVYLLQVDEDGNLGQNKKKDWPEKICR